MTETIFGPRWEDLGLGDVERYLAGAEDEPLEWEAKGADAEAHHVRRAVCAFANSHDGGYLIVGAEQTPNGFDLLGKAFPDEPHVWVSNVVRNGVRPPPEVKTRAFSVGEDRHVVVVWVPPVATPPCISRGTVFERVPGASPAVKDPTRLAQLYQRGDAAHEAALARADRARKVMLKHHEHPLESKTQIGFVLAAAATGYANPDMSRELFSSFFEDAAQAAIDALPMALPMPYTATPAVPVWTQDTITWTKGPDHQHSPGWTVRVDWSGSAAAAWTLKTDRVATDSLVTGPVAEAWQLLLSLLIDLGATTSHQLSLTLVGAQFAAEQEAFWVGRDPYGHLPTLRRGPLALRSDPAQLASLARETARALGERAYEPGPDGSEPSP